MITSIRRFVFCINDFLFERPRDIFSSIQNSYLPARDRCKPQTFKSPTGVYDRSKLLDFLAEQGKNEKDWDEHKPYVPGEKKGKVWQAPEPVAAPADEDNEFTGSTEWDDVLTNATETEIVELAGKNGSDSD